MITILVYLLLQTLETAATAYPEHILLNCGSNSVSKSSDGQSWDGDAGTKLSPDIHDTNVSIPATAKEQDPSMNGSVPYMTARIIRSKFSYIFPLSSGQKILRLYFHPATYAITNNTFITQPLSTNQSFFAVTANQYALLSNLSTNSYFVKEFIVNIQENQALNVTFLPMPDSYAYINGIEVVSIPAHVFMSSYDMSTPRGLRGSTNAPRNIINIDQNKTAIEALYRINMGGGRVYGKDDSGMFREWLQDDNFQSGFVGDSLRNDTISLNYTSQTPNYSAPAAVYRTARAVAWWRANETARVDLQWRFQVDSGFYYLLRLHFCEFMPDLVNSSGYRVFTILINEVPVEKSADVIHWTGGTGIPIFKDYVTLVANYPDGQSKQGLVLTLRRPDDNNDYAANVDQVYGPILNGLEIFKLNRTDVVLAVAPSSASPDLEVNSGSSSAAVLKQPEKKNLKLWIIPVVIRCVLLMLLFALLVWPRREHSAAVGSIQSSSTETKTSISLSSLSVPLSDLCRRFLLEEIKTATSSFDPTLVIGKGGFGNVYRGYIDGNLAVAMKRSDPCSNQGAHEFRTEIEMLTSLRHLHLVSLIGHCNEGDEMILVYDYMPNGTLQDHLYRTEKPPLTWKQRLEICIGAARGLNYLHSEASQVIIHRDVKSNNILLDENWVAKISDFGLSKMGAPDESFTYFSTNVKGTFGYLDPEYFSTKKLTRKSDVYAFGVVLFEVLSGRAAVDMQLEDEQQSLATWARHCIRNSQVDKLIDTNLEGQISPDCLRLFVGVARRCLDTHPPERPPMADVVVSLERALALQQNPSSAQQANEEEI